MPGIRPIEPGDLDRIDEIHSLAFELEGARRSPFFRGRLDHAVATDPDGAFVAVGRSGRVDGVAMASRRDGLWGLTLLAVDPATQERGLGGRLLTRALAYAEPGDARMVLASHDPRAQHLYARAGFLPRPTVAARGVVSRRGLAPTPRVREGGPGDLELCAAVDRRTRGFARAADLAFLMRSGARLWLIDDDGGQGYALGQAERVTTLCAGDGVTAGELLTRVLARSGPGEFEVAWLTEGQRWAFPALFAAGLSVLPWGPIWADARVGPLVPYVPSGALL
ncbi:MAG: GNAT family N-acetyltransferase [Solirubrobacteraceae bacterium]